MNRAATSDPDKSSHARNLCFSKAWPDLLAFAEKWHAESPADNKALYYQGVALAAMGRCMEAETAYRRALALDERDFKTLNNLAAILFGPLKKPMDALRCMEQAMKIEPYNKQGWANLASMVGQLGRHEKAMEFANRALALDPQFVEAHLHRATAAKALGKTDVVKEASLALGSIAPDKFRRSR
jgi:tetratricopeptide (TPR) repeat protein